jgi:hypothetical protein
MSSATPMGGIGSCLSGQVQHAARLATKNFALLVNAWQVVIHMGGPYSATSVCRRALDSRRGKYWNARQVALTSEDEDGSGQGGRAGRDARRGGR